MEYLGNFEVWQYIVFSGVFFVSCLLQGVIGFGAGAFGIPILYFCGFEIDTGIVVDVAVGSNVYFDLVVDNDVGIVLGVVDIVSPESFLFFLILLAP